MEKNLEKSLTMPKKLQGGPFGIFQHPFCRKTRKILKGDTLEKNFSEKSRNAEKLKGGPFGLVRYFMLRGEPFWFSSLGQQGQFCRIFGRTILVTSGVSKKI